MVADGMLAAGQVALMVAAVILALLIFLEAVERSGWQLIAETDRADRVSSEATVEASLWP